MNNHVDTVEVLNSNINAKRTNKIPKIVAILGSIPIILNGIWIALSCLAFLGATFGANTVLGFILILTPLGWILTLPVYAVILAFSWFDIPKNYSAFEYRTRVFLYFLAALALPWLVYYLVILFDGFILGFIGSFLK